MLAFGFAISAREASNVTGGFAMLNCIANCAAIIRLHFRMNKYALWILMAIVSSFARALTLPGVSHSPILVNAWSLLYVTSTVGVVIMGIAKIQANKCINNASELVNEEESDKASVEKQGEVKIIESGPRPSRTVLLGATRDM